ncbi:T9SS type A sorting domain-containing protein [Olleya sp. YS]|uniref:T9SS type A sorting domain-containing protein n=1 Tax=Olleya sp. YS TaxID=3028318 RepID=UPI0024344A1C|nr:T9SS type A sorting domain-containing protein [Olleya sp. YS]WGD34792.1 T9SS type A sorting domain-containing protein [Olleya sp. YS]
MKKITLLIFMLFTAFAFAQVQVGTGTTTTTNVPIVSCYGYTYAQQVYYQSEINSAGNITSISFYMASAPATNNESFDWTVYLGHSTKTEFASTTDWEANANLTQVYTGNVTYPANGNWMEIIFDTPFAYNNVDNLIVAVDENQPGWDCSIAWNKTDSAVNRSIWYRNDSTNPDPAAPPTATSRGLYFANAIFGGLTAATPPNCDATLTQTTDVPVNGDISWSGATGSAGGYILTVGSTTGGTDILDNVDVGNVLAYNLGALSPATTYYATITPYNANGSATGCVEQSFVTFDPVQGDTFNDPLPITPSAEGSTCDTSAYTFSYDYSTGVSDSGTSSTCGTTSTFDMFFSWTATSDALIWNDGASNPGVAVYDATGTQIICLGTFAATDAQLSGWTIGDDLIIQVYDFGTTGTNPVSFCLAEFTLPDAPENDDCSAAVALTVNEDLTCAEVTNGTIVGATNSGVDNCGGTEDDDVWYSFVATNETHQVSLINITGGTTDLYHAVYDADPGCGSLAAALTCSDPNTSTTSGLTIGNTYFVQVYSWTGTAGQTSIFDICIGTPPPPPANDNCDDAEMLSVNTDGTCTLTTSGTLVSSTESTINPTCDTGTEWDVWYSFVAPSSGNVDFTVTLGTGNPLEYAIFDDCAGTTQLYCSDPLNGAEITGLTAGTTYYLMVWNDGFETPGDFTICASEPTCTPATATYTIVNDCDNSGGFLIDVEITDLGTATALTVSNDQDATTFNVTAVGTFQFGPYANATDVVITVADDNDSNCTFTSGTLTQSVCPPDNDDIANATAITIGEMICDGTTNNGTNEGATDSGEGAGTCYVGGAGSDVWYTFTVASDSNVDVSTDYLGGTLVDTQIAIFSGTSGALTQVACSQDEGVVILSNGSSWNSLITNQAVTAGTYYIQVSGYNGAEGTFCLSVDISPPANDECATAEALTLGTEITADNTGGTDSMVAGDCFTGAIADLWYSFVATSTGEVTITTTAAQYGVYSDCAGTQVGACNTSVVSGLTDGTTYYVRVSDDGTARALAPGSFTLLVAESSLGTNEFNTESLFSYYPNPVNDNLTLKAQKEINNVSVYNMLGQEVYRNAPNSVNNTVDMSNLQSGAYFVKVTIENVTETIKVIKK